ncbi:MULTISPECIES: site-specific DNA-methyltransferase [unclassified Pseudomonas]|uniref:site-specific DNA-methyltransferase n=1 Tax=unclassified Pseudomonas TaxID=196821 RepID=UPI00093013A3|nr:MULTISPECIES: site-specific DNA-methyltransferase [unclassified Pseudomonas]
MLKKIKKHSCDGGGVSGEIIHGDNLLVLQDLLKKYRGAVKCVYIDPPYNNGEDYSHYMDNRAHLEWLSMIEVRLKLLRDLLADDGSIWISIDDGEVHYLKVAADKIFGRENFVTTVIWQQRTTRENRKAFSNNHEYILVYAKSFKRFAAVANKLPGTQEIIDRYKNPDNDPRGPWQSVSANVQAGHAVPSQFYEVTSPSGRVHSPPNGRCWAYNKARMDKEIAENNVWFGKDGAGVPRIKKFLRDKVIKVTPETIWLAEECGTSKSAKKQLLKMFPDETVFDTPKPEELIRKVLSIATNPGDLVLDAFLGSGTTAAVAHKMNRRYIGIETGDHIVDIVVRRLRYVIDGDTDGITKVEGWRGGGGFEFLRYTAD